MSAAGINGSAPSAPNRPLSAHRGPGAVGVAAGGAAGNLRAAADIDRVAVFAAARPASFVIRPRNDRPIISRVIAAPADRRTWRTPLQCVHLGRVGALTILLVQRGADGAAEQPPGRGTDRRTGQPAARPSAAEHGAERPAGNRTG